MRPPVSGRFARMPAALSFRPCATITCSFVTPNANPPRKRGPAFPLAYASGLCSDTPLSLYRLLLRGRLVPPDEVNREPEVLDVRRPDQREFERQTGLEVFRELVPVAHRQIQIVVARDARAA